MFFFVTARQPAMSSISLSRLMEAVFVPLLPLRLRNRNGTEQSPLIACGHTHIPRSVRSNGGQRIVNPGSVGLQAYDDIHPIFHIVETGSPDARYAIIEKLNNEWTVSLLSVPYDHGSMAQLARINGRPDWEHALLKGYMQ
jgi:diadenosine tetraphosphatase ApaH/serine/threonine PP2A family protein phosphatase